MVDFTLTDEQKALREMAHDFAEKEIRPVAWEYDKDGTWPEEIIEKAWELGLMNTHIPEEYGGPGAGYLDGCLIEEELAWGCSGIGTSIGCNGLATAPLVLGGSEELKKQYLGRLTEAPLLASFCLTEPDAGSDVSGMKTTAVKKGDKWVINGSKCFITNGGYADWYTVYAKTDKEAGHRGISAFIVPRDAGVIGRQEGGQDGPAGVEHGDHHLQRRRDPRRAPDRRGEQGLQARDDDARPHAPRRGGDGGRHRARRDGVRDRLLEGARPVRRADRDAPGDPVHDRRHGDRGRGGPPADLAGARSLLDQGKRNTLVVLARQALRRRHRDGGHHRRRAGLRRLRLHQGVPGREADARREDHAALRGHLADPAPRDRARDAAPAPHRAAAAAPPPRRRRLHPPRFRRPPPGRPFVVVAPVSRIRRCPCPQ